MQDCFYALALVLMIVIVRVVLWCNSGGLLVWVGIISTCVILKMVVVVMVIVMVASVTVSDRDGFCDNCRVRKAQFLHRLHSC